MSIAHENAPAGRILWRSRRGLLELDLLLLPFVRDHYARLSTADKGVYELLLEYEDVELLAWLQGRVRPPNEDLMRIVALVIEAAGGGSSAR